MMELDRQEEILIEILREFYFLQSLGYYVVGVDTYRIDYPSVMYERKDLKQFISVGSKEFVEEYEVFIIRSNSFLSLKKQTYRFNVANVFKYFGHELEKKKNILFAYFQIF